jgi:hypothetical protein
VRVTSPSPRSSRGEGWGEGLSPQIPNIDACGESPRCGRLVRHHQPATTRRDAANALKLLPLSDHSGHGRISCWLDPVANDPTQKFPVPTARTVNQLLANLLRGWN